MASDSPIVRDLVIPLKNYPHLKENQTLHEAVAEIYSFTCGETNRIRYSEILILNDRNQLSGHVTLLDILQNLDPRLKEATKIKEFEGKGSEFHNLSILWEDSFFIECTKRSHIPIREFMSPIRHTVNGNDSVLKVLAIMARTKDVALPVVEEKHIIGVIRLKEIFKAIAARCRI
jgi:Mg/Co/Ni transporter MgtE